MIKESDYINLLENSRKIFSYSFIFPNHFIDALNDIRKCNNKYSKEIRYYFLYPRYDLEKANMWRIEIETLCDKYNINYQFSYLDEWTKKSEIYVRYFFNSIEITDLINV